MIKEKGVSVKPIVKYKRRKGKRNTIGPSLANLRSIFTPERPLCNVLTIEDIAGCLATSTPNGRSGLELKLKQGDVIRKCVTKGNREWECKDDVLVIENGKRRKGQTQGKQDIKRVESKVLEQLRPRNANWEKVEITKNEPKSVPIANEKKDTSLKTKATIVWPIQRVQSRVLAELCPKHPKVEIEARRIDQDSAPSSCKQKKGTPPKEKAGSKVKPPQDQEHQPQNQPQHQSQPTPQPSLPSQITSFAAKPKRAKKNATKATNAPPRLHPHSVSRSPNPGPDPLNLLRPPRSCCCKAGH